MTSMLYSAAIQTEEDVVSVRRKARQIAAALGFDHNEQTRISTAVSEVARDAFAHSADAVRAANATHTADSAAQFTAEFDAGWFTIRILAHARPANGLDRLLESATALALTGAERLMDEFRVEPSGDGASTVILRKRLTAKAPPTPQRLAGLAAELAQSDPQTAMEDLRRENREALRLMEELRARQDELARLNAELEHTNRGVVALYAEIDEKAEKLRRADQMKSRFLSHMSHEFRTPLTSIMALSRLLSDEVDGSLSPEQHKQAMFIRKSAESLLDMVNELLEMARLEAGKGVVRPVRFTVTELFSSLQGVLKPLRGVIRPLTSIADVELTFDAAAGIPTLYTDEAKIAQILRNFVSNALKFTERGKIQVHAELAPSGHSVVFSVSDTGIGIPAAHLDTIFQEFAQIENAVQRKVSGSGLGLPLAKGLAQLLGGAVGVTSRVGEGSTFCAEIPLRYPLQDEAVEPSQSVLVIDDEEVSRYLVRQALRPSVPALEASSGRVGIDLARSQHPRAILLDLNMPNMDGFQVLEELKAHPESREIPVVILTAYALTGEQLAKLDGRVASVLSKELLSQTEGSARLRTALQEENLHDDR